jgi:orotidine-5'-phosphate decarboxylase
MTPATTFANRLASLDTVGSRLCVGVDPHPGILSDWGLSDTAEGAKAFGLAIVEAVVDTGVRLLKPQVAFFERHGIAGMSALADIIGQARADGVVVIADAKRGDVGSTVAAYAEAWLGVGSDFESDAMTAVAYQGVGSVEPMCETALAGGKGLFVLVNTSNPDGWDIQQAEVSPGTSLAQRVFDDLVARQDLSGVSGWMGCVVGATLPPADRAVQFPDPLSLWVLAPGFGYQGAQLSELTTLFGPAAHRVIPTVSRSVCQGGRAGVAEAIGKHLGELSS